MNIVKKTVLPMVLAVMFMLNLSVVYAETLVGEETYKYFTYNVNSNNTVSIISCTANNEEVIIPDKIKNMDVWSVHSDAFNNCPNLKKILVYETCKYFSAQDGILYNKAKTQLIRCPSETMLKTVYIPQTVTKIISNAFLNCEGISLVNVPKNVSDIGSNAFFNTGFTSITLNNPSVSLDEKCVGYEESGTVADFTVYCPDNSSGFSYAQKNNLSVITTDNTQNYNVTVNGNLYYHTHQSNFSGANILVTDNKGNSVKYNFSSSPSAVNKKYSNAFVPVNIIDEFGNTITKVNVKTAVAGDVDMNGKLNVRDAAKIASQLAKGENFKGFPGFCADINDDGKANIRDAAAIARTLANKFK